MSVDVGKKAPEFAALDSKLKEKKLSDYKGRKTVLVFFPGAFTSVCTKELCTFRDSMAAFNDLDSQVVGISVDQPFSLAEFAKQNSLEFDLLSDADRSISETYGALHNDFVGVKGLTASKRSVFILDADGVVKYAWVSEDPGKEPDYETVKAELAKLN